MTYSRFPVIRWIDRLELRKFPGFPSDVGVFEQDLNDPLSKAPKKDYAICKFLQEDWFFLFQLIKVTPFLSQFRVFFRNSELSLAIKHPWFFAIRPCSVYLFPSQSGQGSSLLLGETSDCVYFDNDGFYGADQKRCLGRHFKVCSLGKYLYCTEDYWRMTHGGCDTIVTLCHFGEISGESMSQRFQRDSTVAVLLNLDASSPNANTAALAKSLWSSLKALVCDSMW